MTYHRILVPTDFSPSADLALVHGLFHAETYSCELHIVHCLSWVGQELAGQLPDADEIMKKMERVARVRLAEAHSRNQRETLEMKEACVVGSDPAKAILDYIEEHEIDLVVMGTHGRTGFQHFLLGSTAEQVVRLAPCPVITVRNQERVDELKTIQQVLVPLDFSIQSNQVLLAAKEFAALHQARLTLLHVIQYLEGPKGRLDAGFVLMNEILPKLKAQCMEELSREFVKAGGPDVEPNFEILIGQPYRRIVEYAKRLEASYLFVGTHGYSGWNHLVLGSTTERLLRLAPCPVFTWKLPAKTP